MRPKRRHLEIDDLRRHEALATYPRPGARPFLRVVPERRREDARVDHDHSTWLALTRRRDPRGSTASIPPVTSILRHVLRPAEHFIERRLACVRDQATEQVLLERLAGERGSLPEHRVDVCWHVLDLNTGDALGIAALEGTLVSAWHADNVGFRPTAQAWNAHADAWAAWARTPDHDYHYERLNLPWFLELLPAPRGLTVDLACGEGRLGRVLAGLGHSVIGVDSSPALVRLAREAGGHRDVLEAAADAVPLPDGCADLVTVFMALQDMDDLAGPIVEAGRLLGGDGRLCLAVPHPFAEMTRERPDSPGYFAPYRYVDVIESAGVRMTFESWRRPLSAYTQALERAGFVIEAMREPAPDAAALEAAPGLASWCERPLFLQIRALLVAPSMEDDRPRRAAVSTRCGDDDSAR